MLFLLFQIGEDTYAIEATRVVEVLPQLRIKSVPQAAPGLAGLVNYRGQAVPVIDLSLQALQRPAQPFMSTRLIIVPFEPAPRGVLALLAEQATDTARLDPPQFKAPGVDTPAARYLGPVATLPDGRLIQWVKPDALLSATVYATLTAEPPPAA